MTDYLGAGIHPNVPDTVYHADPCEEPSLSSSIAAILWERSPKHAMVAHPRLAGVVDDEPSRRMSVGSVAHRLALEGNDDRVHVIEAVNRNGDTVENYQTKAAREERDAALAAGAIPILQHEYDDVRGMVDALNREGVLPAASHRESTIIWTEDECWFRARLDCWWADDALHIHDFKTTALAANPGGWGRRQIYEYLMQVGFYSKALLSQYPDADDVEFTFVVQETAFPYGVARFQLDAQSLEYAHDRASWAMERWKDCIKRDRWPSYPSGVHVLETPGWLPFEQDR